VEKKSRVGWLLGKPKEEKKERKVLRAIRDNIRFINEDANGTLQTTVKEGKKKSSRCTKRQDCHPFSASEEGSKIHSKAFFVISQFARKKGSTIINVRVKENGGGVHQILQPCSREKSPATPTAQKGRGKRQNMSHCTEKVQQLQSPKKGGTI